jgi:flagellar biosynthesis chaperone FliJ
MIVKEFRQLTRQREKAEARKRDELALKEGRMTVAELSRLNGFISSLDLKSAKLKFED